MDDSVSEQNQQFCVARELTDIQRELIKESIKMQVMPHIQAIAQKEYPYNQTARQNLLHELEEQCVDDYLKNDLVSQQKHQIEQIKQINRLCSLDSTSQFEFNHYKMFGVSAGRLEMPVLNAASMWERPGVLEFKSSFSSNPSEPAHGKICVSSGELLVVRIPVDPDFNGICWEFATDDYDIGFGLFFEWSIHPQREVSVHLTDSSSGEEDEWDDGSEKRKTDNSTAIGQLASIEQINSAKTPEASVDQLVANFRRSNCFSRVCVGFHTYPGLGTYLFKFDNSYSLWRSKNIYYRIVACDSKEVSREQAKK